MTQPSIQSARVVIVGMGGLGCPVSLELARAGVRHLTLVDADRVDVTNLHRQPWYQTAHVGSPKVTVAAARLRQLFSGITIEEVHSFIDEKNVDTYVANVDLIIDGCDQMDVKFLLSDAAIRHQKWLIYGGVLRASGQAMAIVPNGPCLRCLFEMPEEAPSCAQTGVLGSVAGVIGGFQAALALDVLRRGTRTTGESRLMVFDAQTFEQRQIRVKKAGDCRVCGEGTVVEARQ